ncbi:MAG: NapC/NirT family cytochrome c, partial [Candidatus Omnitrophica bacterium]|nr:NapC/NirT family cytochrome c [Candidatus Omnitrophota bacterium]
SGVGASLIFYDLVWGHANPYTGVVTYLLTPMFLSIGLSMVGVSWVLRVRARLKGSPETRQPFVINFGDPRHARKIKYFGLFLTVFACLSAVGSYRSYHFTESTEFCGLTCHQVMKPEYVTYHNSPHAKVSCVECHIGAGADWYVKSKLSGLRQVFAYSLETYHLPIETPIRDLRPARETCEECHWPDKFSGNLEKTIVHYTNTDENTPYVIRMLLKVGGGQGEKATGIHWHVSSGYKIEYIATDRERLKIPWVRMTDREGRSTVFTSEDCPPEIASSTHELRTMDCIDCHNRPSHIFRDPTKLVNDAISHGDISVALPGVKGTVMELLETAYPTTETALETIEKGMRENLLADADSSDATRATTVDRAIESVKKIYSENFFPEMNVDWTTHPAFTGHFRWDGCYRCHDGKHKAETGDAISHSCDNCHVITGQGEGFEFLKDLPYQVAPFNHPLDMGELDESTNCTECHAAPEPTDYPKVRAEATHARTTPADDLARAR